MAFTPQSSPTRVSTISCVICCTTSKLRKKLYDIQISLTAASVPIAPSNFFYLEPMEFT